MPLSHELRKDIESRLAAIEKQLNALSRVKADEVTDAGVHVYLLEREKAFREDQLRRGRA